ncbi:ABC transporter ATP-binding protein [Thermoactinomyces sp. CICC 23799]|uniref:ABC transporter ATP-binding protein n=1 Tax=Thermoactinomyces sp. CICC 23799 TaxID=2767429 RepID=UPI0018DC4514|nr:ATP-binding cassette domain-containing protein [Thermoactinomyces sp. CICC 23799]MBH8601516.1 ATP-binding cassette domain-containing protein [Thermoactinomyces sp. CICC 23799]
MQSQEVFHLNRQPFGTRLNLKDLQKQYDGRLILDHINLQITPGEFIAVVGRSGTGKSTLLRLIAGIEKTSGGKIIQDGEFLTGINSAARMMFQESRLLPWKKVFQNVALGIRDKRHRKEKTELMLEKVGLDQYKDEWPRILSGGQRQRVALARALVSRPRLLLLDEPLGALDAFTRIEMQKLIEELWQEQKFTALLVTHDVEEAVTLADRVILLKDGKVATDIPVTLPRPRQRDDARFSSLTGRILKEIMDTAQPCRNESSASSHSPVNPANKLPEPSRL